ncbi:hypothetical protein A3Q56_02160 [Intoshia linei]|uniref:HTH CENPB-type domain-containing protein n=1 Tax=Intoshia linei TaxID=1819745 RepID=A0A177B7J9_9BILA|nr:hypothetical protein A3Q56_02160 [Intoshia linei]
MNNEVFMHFLKRRESKLPVFGYMLKGYGRQYLQKNDPTRKLKCSYGWLQNFRKIFPISLRQLSRESLSADITKIEE